MKYFYASLLLGLLLLGCAPSRTLSNADHAYLEKAGRQPLEFTVAKSDAAVVWARMQTFVADHSSMKIQTVTTNVLQTYTPYGWALYGYQCTMLPIRDSIRFRVIGTYDQTYSQLKENARENAHVCAYFARTGDEPSSAVVWK